MVYCSNFLEMRECNVFPIVFIPLSPFLKILQGEKMILTKTVLRRTWSFFIVSEEQFEQNNA